MTYGSMGHHSRQDLFALVPWCYQPINTGDKISPLASSGAMVGGHQSQVVYGCSRTRGTSP